MKRPRARAVFVGSAIWLGVALCGPAFGAVTIGPTGRPDPSASQNINYPSGSVVFNDEDSPSSIPLRSPIDGVVTRWRTHTGDVSAGSALQLRVLTPMGGDSYLLAASGPAHAVGPMSGSSNPQSFDVRVPIRAGQMIGTGVYHPNPGFLEVTLATDVPAPAFWALGEMTNAPPDGITASASVSRGVTVGAERYTGLSADIEPDADADGFGDETQDLCPADPVTHGTCPSPLPDTARPGIALSGVPRAMSLRAFLRGVRVVVRPSEPVALRAELFGSVRRARVSAFDLRLASRSAGLAVGNRTLRLKPRRALVGRPAKPFRVRVRVTATDAAGNATVASRALSVRRR